MPNQYYKLGKNASIFFDVKTGLKVTKNVPGLLTKPISKRVEEAHAKGHITPISESEAQEMLSQHGENVSKNNLMTKADRIAREKQKKAAAVTPEDLGDGDGDDILTRKDMIEEIMDNPNIPEEVKPSKKQLKAMSDQEIDSLHTELMEKYPAE